MDKEDPRNWQPIDFEALRDPFPAEDIEWRVQSAGTKGDKVWAKCLAYIQSRAVMDRLDEVCKPINWQTRVEHTQGGFIAGIGIFINGEWVWKYDGAQSTDIEAVKGGISGAIKRAAVHWGIGRYLYNLKEFFADISPQGMYYQPEDKKNKKYKAFKWNPPKLPVWALPKGHKNVEREPMPEGGSTPLKISQKGLRMPLMKL